MIAQVHCKGTVGSTNYNLTFMHLQFLTIKVSSFNSIGALFYQGHVWCSAAWYKL